MPFYNVTRTERTNFYVQADSPNAALMKIAERPNQIPTEEPDSRHVDWEVHIDRGPGGSGRGDDYDEIPESRRLAR